MSIRMNEGEINLGSPPTRPRDAESPRKTLGSTLGLPRIDFAAERVLSSAARRSSLSDHSPTSSRTARPRRAACRRSAESETRQASAGSRPSGVPPTGAAERAATAPCDRRGARPPRSRECESPISIAALRSHVGARGERVGVERILADHRSATCRRFVHVAGEKIRSEQPRRTASRLSSSAEAARSAAAIASLVPPLGITPSSRRSPPNPRPCAWGPTAAEAGGLGAVTSAGSRKGFARCRHARRGR